MYDFLFGSAYACSPVSIGKSCVFQSPAGSALLHELFVSHRTMKNDSSVFCGWV